MKLKEPSKEEIASLYQSGWSTYRIGQKFEVSRKAVERFMRRFGIEITRGGIKKGEHRSPETEFRKGQKPIAGFTSERSKAMWSERREELITKQLAGLFKRPTSLELYFIRLIEQYGLPLKYCGDGRFLIGFKNPDFHHSAGKKICLEVANWIHHDEQWAKERINHFAKCGWKCLVVFAHRTKDRSSWVLEIPIETIQKEVIIT